MFPALTLYPKSFCNLFHFETRGFNNTCSNSLFTKNISMLYVSYVIEMTKIGRISVFVCTEYRFSYNNLSVLLYRRFFFHGFIELQKYEALPVKETHFN